MSTIKRRRLDIDSPGPQPLSAIARRKAAGQTVSTPVSQVEIKDRPEDVEEAAAVPAKRRRKGRGSAAAAISVDVMQPAGEATEISITIEKPAETPADTDTQSRPESPTRSAKPSPRASRRSPAQLSTFSPTKRNFSQQPNGAVKLRLEESERIIILGSFGVRVLEGEVTVYGAHLRPGDKISWVHAPHCHAVPVLRCAEKTALELHSHPQGDSLQRLGRLSPLFRKLWHDAQPSNASSKRRVPPSSTFQIMYTSENIPKRAVVQDLVAPAEWNKAIAGISTSKASGKASRVIVCGPRSSGKSTFGRILGNKLLTASKPFAKGIAVLDLDPGQPEYAPAGLVSLVHCRAPNLGPPFTHPIPDGVTSAIIRSHSLASHSPAADPQLYMECAMDLFTHYTRSFAHCPLIVNTPGWIQGTGLDLLVELIGEMNPTDVIYMSEDGPADSVESLKDASRGGFLILPSQPSEYASRTAAQLRAMHALSYFHSAAQTQSGASAWDPAPITSKTPWQVRFGGANAGVASIMSYEYQPPTELLGEAINGSVLSLVEIHDMKALRALESADTDEGGSEPAASIEIPDEALAYSPEGIPCFLNPNSISLDPSYSHALGLVLIRGIDPITRSLQLLTPISIERIKQARAAGHALVLVHGNIDTPAWAYTEDMYERAYDVDAMGALQATDGPDDTVASESSESSESEDESEGLGTRRRVDTDAGCIPWVEVVEGNKKRPVGSKVWRVRRDLGRAGAY